MKRPVILMVLSFAVLSTGCSQYGQPKPANRHALEALTRRIETAFLAELELHSYQLKKARQDERMAYKRVQERQRVRVSAEKKVSSVRRILIELRDQNASPYQIERVDAKLSSMLANLRKARDEESSARREHSRARHQLEVVNGDAKAAHDQRQREFRSFHEKANAYQRHRSPENYYHLVKAQIKSARSLGLKSKVEWKTKPKSGAEVFYIDVIALAKKDDPIRLDRVTDCTQEVVPGEYCVWSKREGRLTSNRRKIFIVNPQEKVEILEQLDLSSGGESLCDLPQ